MPAHPIRIHVIGGGIAGLAAALRVRTLAPDANVTIFETSPEPGGKIRGDIVQGCVADRGADVCIGERLRSTHLFDQLDLASTVIRVNPNSLPTYQLRDGALHRFPVAFNDELLTFSEGMRGLVTRVCSALSGVTASMHTTAASLTQDGSYWRVVTDDGVASITNAVIIATPARAAATLLQSVVGSEASRLAPLNYPPTTTVTMAWRSRDVPRTLDGTGYLVSDALSPVTACTWVSAKNPSHAPDGVALLRCYIRGSGDDPIALMKSEVASTLGITADPLFARTYRWETGIPVYDSAHPDLVGQLTNALQGSGVFVAGSAFHGVGIPDCIHSGERAADAAVKHALTQAANRAGTLKPGEAA